MVNIYYKEHLSPHGNVLAVCDKELLGKKIENSEISVKISEAFYGRTEISAGALKEKLKSFDNINLIGEQAVKTAVEEKLAEQKNIIFLGKIPHLQIYKIG